MRGHTIQALAVVLSGLLAGCGDSAASKRAAEETKEAVDAAARAAKAAGEKVRVGAEKAVDVVESGAKVAGEKIEEGAEDAARHIQHGADKVEQGAREALEKGKQEFREIKGAAKAGVEAANAELEKNDKHETK